MERFDATRDPLMERVAHEELRELLQRLGEAESGDDRATVGAIVEATGADAAKVLALLREIRADRTRAEEETRWESPPQNAVEAVESPRELHEVRLTPGPDERITLDSMYRRLGVTLVLLFAVLLLIASVTPRGADMPPKASMTIPAGTLTLGNDDVLRVVLPDGTVRMPTHEEFDEGLLLYVTASESSQGRR